MSRQSRSSSKESKEMFSEDEKYKEEEKRNAIINAKKGMQK